MLYRIAIALACAACGRVGFSPLGSPESEADAGSGDASGATGDAPAARITHVGVFVARSPGTGPTDSFNVQAHAAGNAIVMQVSCAANAVPSAVAVTAPGWMFTQLGPITASTRSPQRSATVVAFAPDADPTTVSIAWSGSNCGSSKNHLGDEFAMVDRAGGAVAFDGFAATEGSGNCVGSVTIGHANDVVWGACNSDDSVAAIGAGFTKAADDNDGDWAEYKITTDPAGTSETVQFANSVGYVLSMVTLKPQ